MAPANAGLTNVEKRDWLDLGPRTDLPHTPAKTRYLLRPQRSPHVDREEEKRRKNMSRAECYLLSIWCVRWTLLETSNNPEGLVCYCHFIDRDSQT